MHNAQYESKRINRMFEHQFSGKPNFMEKIIDTLRASAWFEFVRSALQRGTAGMFYTAYAIGKHIEPDTYRGGNEPNNNNRWSKYARGKHVPGPDTLEQVEAFAPGARALVESPVWSLLDCSRPLHSDDGALRLMTPCVFDCLFVPGSGYQGSLGTRRSLDDTLERLVHHVNGLKTLAAGVWVLREAKEQADAEQCLEIGMYLHRMLLMSLSYAPWYQMRYSLVTYFHQYIFPLASSGDIKINPSCKKLMASVEAFQKYVLILEDCGVLGDYTPNESTQWCKMFGGTFGLDLMYGLGPHYGLRARARNPQARTFVQMHKIFRDWSLSVVARGGCQQFPPKEVRSRARAVGMAPV